MPMRECQGIRSDGKTVIFKKLEKVGKPYAIYCPPINNNIFLQRYRTYETPIFNETDTVFFTTGGYLFLDIEIKQNQEDMEENKPNLKPFDLEQAKAGKPVCTRDGRKARIICYDKKDADDIYPIVYLIQDDKEEQLYVCTSDGKCFVDKDEHSCDLMMLPEKKEGWINIYKKSNGECYFAHIYDTKALAKIGKNAGCIATVRTEWEE